MAVSAASIDPVAARNFAVEVVRRLRDAGYEALWAGGCVRDELLGGHPKDYDVATSALPQQVREVFGQRRTLALGATFGVISVLGPREAGQVEVATFRRDAGYSDGRRPDHVTFSSAEEDAQRRDFTINGLFYDPLSGRVIDYVGGVDDLHARVVRAIRDPHERFAEDKLRMLRAVRFTATFGFELEPETLAAIKMHAREVVVVSAERIAAEMRRMLCHVQRSLAANLLRDTGLLEVIWPESGSLSADPWQETLVVLRHLDGPAFGTALAALVRGSVHEHPTIAIQLGERWRLSNEEIALIHYLLRHEKFALAAPASPWPQVQRMLIEPAAPELVKYVRAIEHVLHGATPAADFCHSKLALPRELLDPPPLVTGADLKALGLPPGPKFKPLLENVRDRQLEGQVTSKEDALAYIRTQIGTA